MGLKQSIVVVNEYTVKGSNGKGSRGSSPGDYVARYMARNKATEDLTPVRLHELDDYVVRCMGRKEATDRAESVPGLKDDMRQLQGYGGVAFGYGDASLSDEKFRYASRDIQRCFDNGKTVMKTVVSFSEDYLKEQGIVETEFVCKERGDYRGNIDQMKLRRAIMNGMERLSKDYDDLQYVGVIQVDTKHVHCHLAMVDRGEGNLSEDGTQKGKLSEKHKQAIRRGIDLYLDEQQKVQHLSANVSYDKRNALCFIKKFTHRAMEEGGISQFLLATLPEDDRLWRAGTNRKEMRKANAICREYVNEVLAKPGSGYREALRSIDTYARTRQEREKLSDMQYRELYRNGQERLISDCMNGVYSMMRSIPKEERVVRTPMLDVMSMDYEDMANDAASDPMIEFGFKLRSYSSRLNHHKKERHKYQDAAKNYEQTQNVSEAAKPLYDYFKYEEEYNEKLMCKYQHFLLFLPPQEEYEEEFEELMNYKGRLRDLHSMREDASMRRMDPDNAELYGRQVYNQNGGRYTVLSPQVLENRELLMQQRYDQKETDLKSKLMDNGQVLVERDDKFFAARGLAYSFEDVKALDIHHLGYDFTHDLMVSKPNVDAFVEAADKRHQLFVNAKEYLVNSGQEFAVKFLPESDVTLMKEIADRMRVESVLVSRRAEGGKKHNGRTVALDPEYVRNMELSVKAVVSSVQLGD